MATAVLVNLTIPSKILGDPPEALYIPTPYDVLSETPTPQELELAVRWLADKYGLGDRFVRTIKCESGFKYNAVGDHGLAYGPAQFHKATFDRYCLGDYKSPKDQIMCMTGMIILGEEHNWTCWK